MIVERDIDAPENIENLVESLEEDGSLNEADAILNNPAEQNIKVAGTDLSSIKTTGREKVVIPAKIKEIDVKLQNSINSENKNDSAAAPKLETQVAKPASPVINKAVKSAKGSWYAQIIASSSRKSVENLWKNLSSKHAFLKSYPFEIEEITAANGNTLYRLKVGAFKTRAEAEKLSSKLKQNQISSIIKLK